MSRDDERNTCPAQKRTKRHAASRPSPPFRRSATTRPSLQGVRPAVASRVNSVAHRVRPLLPPDATRRHPGRRSGERCDRGSDPTVTPSKARLATEGLTQCRAQLNESPVLHRGERSEHAPPLRCLPSVPTGGQTRCCQPSKLGGTSGQTSAATLLPPPPRHPPAATCRHLPPATGGTTFFFKKKKKTAKNLDRERENA